MNTQNTRERVAKSSSPSRPPGGGEEKGNGDVEKGREREREEVKRETRGYIREEG